MRISDWSSDVCSSDLPVGNGAEVVVVELLTLGRLGAKQGAAGIHQVGTGQEEVPVDQEVLLLGTAERHDVVETAVPKQRQDALGLCRSEEHTSELQSLMRLSYAVFCLKKNHLNYQH